MTSQIENNDASRILSVRVTENIYCCYEQIQMLYAIKQSDLIRMAPLLLVLLAEGNLAQRRKKVREGEKELRSKQEIDWNKFREIDRERIAIENNEVLGRSFIDYLRELAIKANSKDEIHINEADDGLPEYLIFQKQLLQQAAAEIADRVSQNSPHEIPNIVQRVDNRYDGQLLAVSRKKLGKELNSDQKSKVREQFINALSIRKGFDEEKSEDGELQKAANEVARNSVLSEDIDSVLQQIGLEGIPNIPPRYDGKLLAISRKNLGKPLNAGEKSKVS